MDLALRSELAVHGLRSTPPVRRRSGAGPSDDGHWRLRDGCSATLPMAGQSPFAIDDDGRLTRDGLVIAEAEFQPVARPRFYDLTTEDGIAYEQLARLPAPMCWPPPWCRPASATARSPRAAGSARSRNR
jgi:hypothetical protein